MTKSVVERYDSNRRANNAAVRSFFAAEEQKVVMPSGVVNVCLTVGEAV